jgi:hypothetical protein
MPLASSKKLIEQKIDFPQETFNTFMSTGIDSDQNHINGDVGIINLDVIPKMVVFRHRICCKLGITAKRGENRHRISS